MGMRGKRKKKVNKEEICEDWCFVCKDGGSLFICEYKDCLKAYHAECVGKDESFFHSRGRLTCEWHSCFICHKRSKYQCYCCPRACCEKCIAYAEFAKLRGSKGFCNNCVKILLLGEEQKEEDSDGEKVDLKDRDTYECLLYEYWLIIKGKEDLSLKDLHLADNILNRGEIGTSLSNPSGSDKYVDASLVSSSEDTVSEFNVTPLQKGKRSKGQKASHKTEVKSKKREFVGWGSRPLIDFLVSIGKDASKEISENDMVSIINEYITKNKLFNPEKKRRVVCDERLKSLFRKKSFMRNSIQNLLELHFRENVEFYEQDQLVYSSEENSKNDYTASKKQKKTVTPKNLREKEVVIEPCRSCFASIVVENIKLVYLKRFIVMELLEEPKTFESNVIGSFVRVKSDPYDYDQKNPYQLVRVTGVKNTSPGGKKEDILLQVSDRFNDFAISKLSDANFSEEECEDLRQRVKSGQLQKLTIVEIEEKAKSLHQIIMKHWIDEELAYLRNQIDRANEKGRRGELFHHMERRMLLETKAEQTRLLEEIPVVIADIPEAEPIPVDANEEFNHIDEIPTKPILTGNLGTLGKIWGGNIASLGKDVLHAGDEAVTGDNSLPGNAGSASANNENGTTKGDDVTRKIQDSDEEESICNDTSAAIQRSELRQSGPQMQCQSDDEQQKTAKTEKALPIELSSDDDTCDGSRISLQKKGPGDLDSPIWLCLGPNGERKGPFSLSLLKRWGDTARYALKFKVWKAGESEDNAIMLSNAVRKFYPGG